eukprot:TRINITY_DN2586_c0_g1_i1.p1 TRINITY_DN2586_c0_g1~~TRINITY_DN2586_c0_g1_i1.p1  ORF type:complete len:952 (+),score=154.71 TRINITY_DN2586_c0_g1_i1:100-2856(+)
MNPFLNKVTSNPFFVSGDEMFPPLVDDYFALSSEEKFVRSSEPVVFSVSGESDASVIDMDIFYSPKEQRRKSAVGVSSRQKKKKKTLETTWDMISPIPISDYVKVQATNQYFFLHNGSECISIERSGGYPGTFAQLDPQKHIKPKYTGYGVLGIVKNKSSSYLILIQSVNLVGTLGDKQFYRIEETTFLPFDPYESEIESNYGNIKKLLDSGLFYVSFNYPITLSVEKQYKIGSDLGTQYMCESSNDDFFWNKYLMRHFLKNKLFSWIPVVTKGYIGFQEDHFEDVSVAVISRISNKKAGLKWNSRGLNDDGNVANFVETEQIIYFKGTKNLSSYVQVRGSVPLFWESRQLGGMKKPDIIRTMEATVPSFNAHFNLLLMEYMYVHCINLLSQGNKREKMLSIGYSKQFDHYPNKGRVEYTSFDFHKICGSSLENIALLMSTIQSSILSFSCFSFQDGKVLDEQKGVFRTNCLDCLERTNYTQTQIGIEVAYRLLNARSSTARILSNLWKSNGDNIGKAYSGTPISKHSKIGSRTLPGIFNSGITKVQRMYTSTKKSFRQNSIDQILGYSDGEFADYYTNEEQFVNMELEKYQALFTNISKKTVYVATWNMNAQSPSSTNLDFLFKDVKHKNTVLYAIGFQEIVTLNGQSVVKADVDNQNMWGRAILEHLNSIHKKEIIMVTSDQLVGITLFIYITRETSLQNLKIEKVKSGVKRLAGNKGAIVARFDLDDTAFCFICCHLAAGQSKMSNRADEIDLIANTKINSRTHPFLFDHDYIFWFGDFNFRLQGINRDEADQHLNDQNWKRLRSFDELRIHKHENHDILSKFTEGKLTFPPTYKYDIGYNRYDTSEKRRVPAWCDRIIYKEKGSHYIHQTLYTRGETTMSDHRPVYSTFEIEIYKIDYEEKNKLEKEILKEISE